MKDGRDSRGNAEDAEKADLDEITGIIVDAAVKLHQALGPGLLELLVNFGGATLKEGLHRIVNNFTPSPSSHLRVNQSGSLPHSRAASSFPA